MDFYIKTFGCQMNENDSALIASLLEQQGYRAVDQAEQADIIIVNTCSVRESAENRALGYIGSLKHLHDTGSAAVIAVMGCMSQRSGVADRLLKSYRQVGIMIGTFAAKRLPGYIQRYLLDGKRIVDVDERYGEEIQRTEQPPQGKQWRAQVNINYGCNNFCSYCIVPYVRGRERSRAPESIVAEIRALADQGLKEVQLLGQNVNSYGKDLAQAVSFGDLLRQIHDIEGLQRIRYMTSHPRDFNQALAETIAQLPKVCRHFHLPIQSGSDRLLKLMNRGYDTGHYRQLLDLIRRLFPEASITTDLILGFPGESEADFQETLDFVREARFDAAYTFLYSRRSGTPAADLPGQVAEDLKKERLQHLMAVQNPISLEINDSLVGREVLLLVEGESKTSRMMLSGRTDGNKIVVFPATKQIVPGDPVRVKITAAQTWNLQGLFLD